MKIASIYTVLVVGLSIRCVAAEKIDVKNLKVGSAYRISRETPLMAEKTVRSRLAAEAEPLADIPAGGAFRVTAVEIEGGWPWYRVLAITQDRTPIGEGYINSVHLLRQKVEHFGVTLVKAEEPKESVGKPPSGESRTYRIAAARDMDYRDPHTRKLIKRKEYRVQLAKEMSKPEMTAVAEEVIKLAPGVNAVVVFFYTPDSEPTGLYTAGKGTWAPNGRWEDAGRMNDKELVVEKGGAPGTVNKDGYVNYPVSKKKAIFYELVELQDQGMDNNQSCAAAAKKHGLSIDQMMRIGTEGAARNWPMPQAK